MPVPARERDQIHKAVTASVEAARSDRTGDPAGYLPELPDDRLEQTSAAIELMDGAALRAGDAAAHRFTLQSSAKLVVLIGLIEERGEAAVFEVVGKEPTEASFASVARLETHGPQPMNPLVNAGAIALCGRLTGTLDERRGWLDRWTATLCGRPLRVDPAVVEAERAQGSRNRAIAHMLVSNGVLEGEVEPVLEAYFHLCSYEADVATAAHLPALLARGGRDAAGREVITERTTACVVSLMATCGMYDESGAYLAATGLPAKSGVSGVIVAVATGRGGIAAASPRLNAKGGSVRGHLILRELSRRLGWHFAVPTRNGF
jgi:glutaminase